MENLMKTLKVEIEVPANVIKNMILVLLLERDSSYITKMTKHSILTNIRNYSEHFGAFYYTDEKMSERYGHYKGYEDKVKKATNILYQYFPELSDEENTVKFIKSLGD